jgi:hypothetical protein
MPLDPNIIAGIKPAQFDLSQFSPMNAMTNVMKFKQADEASQLNALKMAEYERTRTEEQDFRDYLATTEKPNDPANRANFLRYGKTGAAYGENLSKQETAALTQKKTTLDIRAAQRKFGDDLRRELSANPSKENIIAFGQDALLQGLYTKEQVDTTVQQLLSLTPEDRVRILSQSGASASELKPTLTPQTLGGTTRLISTPAFGGAATQVAGSEGTVTMTPAQEREAKDSAIRIKQEGQRIGLEGRRVAVLEEQDKRAKDPVFQQNMAKSKATGEALAKGEVAAKQALPGVITNAMIAVNAVDDMIGKQAVKDASGKVIQPATAPHKGFQDAVGATWKPGFRFIPGTDASDFQSYQDQIEGAAFLSAFEALKGGGAISEKEGSKATAAKLRMKLAQSEVEYVKAAREFQEVVRTGVENARQKFGAGGAPAAGGGNIDALLDKYK